MKEIIIKATVPLILAYVLLSGTPSLKDTLTYYIYTLIVYNVNAEGERCPECYSM